MSTFCFGQQTADNIIHQARNDLEKGNYKSCFKLLSSGMHDAKLDSLSRSVVQYEFAMFYCDYVGNYNKGFDLIKEISPMTVYWDRKSRLQFHDDFSLIKQLKKCNQKLDQLNVELAVNLNQQISGDELMNTINLLTKQVEASPDYYRKAELFYSLGLAYQKSEKYGRAIKHLKKALKEKPAIDFMLPVTVKLNQAKERYQYRIVRSSVLAFLALFIVLTGLLFYRTKPWLWLKWKHSIPFVIVLVLWCVCYFLGFYILGSKIKEFHLQNNSFQQIDHFFLFSGAGGPGGYFSMYLFYYGLWALSGLYVLSLALLVYERKWIKTTALLISGLLLFSSISILFYQNHLYGKGVEKDYGESIWLKSYQFKKMELIPYVLTDPQSFPNVGVGDVPNQVLRDWMMEYCILEDSLSH